MNPSFAVLTALAVHLGTVNLGAAELAEPAEPDVPAGTVAQEPVSGGSTDIEGLGQFAAADSEARESEDATELEISAGGLLSTGNAFAAAVTANGRFRLRRGIHQASAQVAGNYGIADVESSTTRYAFVADALQGNRAVEQTSTELLRDTTVANIQAMARYDVFFARRWSAFLMATARRDRFQGFDLRFNLDPGVAVHVLTRPKHRLWFEAGYDFQYDIRREEAVFEDQVTDPVVDEDGDGFADTQRVRIADDTLINHAARIFAGYNNSLSDRVSFDTGLEYLQSVVRGSRFRVNWVNALTTQLADRLGLSVTFTLRYENEPLPDVRPLDTITAVLLTVRFL